MLVQAVKIDAGLEVDLAAAIKVQKTPVVLFVKSGKILHAVEGNTPILAPAERGLVVFLQFCNLSPMDACPHSCNAGFTSADDLGQIAAHFFYGAKRPKCLDKVASSVKKLEVS